MIVGIISILSIYIIAILCLYRGIYKVKPLALNETKSITTFSIIIPFRNEAKRLPELLTSITQLHYANTHFEVLLVDDDSSDASVAIINSFSEKHPEINIQILDNNRISSSPKKDAITTAITVSKFDWILTTDADCILPHSWLNSYHITVINECADFIAGPVSLKVQSRFFDQFQLLDILSLQGATLGSFGLNKPMMVNAANLGYRKACFQELNGYQNNTHIASGDDVFLLETFIANGLKVQYLNTPKALVHTYPEPQLKALIEQRKRWAAKTKHYNSAFTKSIALIVFFGNLSWAIGLILAFNNSILGVFLIFKLLVDFLLINKTAHLYKQKIGLNHFILAAIFYPFFSTYVAVLSLMNTYQWKDRTFRD